MGIFSSESLTALLAIIVIDLVLAGDNAIVIALAARKLPAHLQRRAILWGAAGAIVVRTAMTLIVVWLLKVPGLLLAGGAMLVWIAYKLLLPEEEGGSEPGIKGAATFWGALKTIVVADTVMGLDNVLGVAGAAHGSFLLVTLGLLISIPIVIWGSTFLLHFVERFPAFVYFGAGVLAWTAVKMMTSEPLLQEFLGSNKVIVPLAYAAVLCGVLWAGFVRNHQKLESRISARLANLSQQRAAGRMSMSGANKGGDAMMKMLVPVDGSANSLHAVRHVVKQFAKDRAMEVHLLNVQPPFSRHIARFVSRGSRDSWHRDEAQKALREARKLFDAAGIAYKEHVEVGRKAEVITGMAKRLGCDEIVMSVARKNSITRMVEASVTNRVLELTTVPVEVIAGDSVSRLERFGIPIGLGIALAMLVLEAVA
jgi:YjbE family integral membrane protein